MKLIAAILAVALVAAACGSDDDDTAADETTTTETAAESTEEDTTTTTETPPETTDTTAGGSDGDAEGADSPYCTVSAEAERLTDEWNIGSPESTEQYFTEVLVLIDSVDPPSEIADDFAVLRQGFVDISAELEQVGWNILALDEDNPILNDSSTEAASDRIEAFDLAYCGPADSASGDPALDGDDLASLLDNPEFQELMTAAGVALTEEQTACLAENLDQELMDSLAGLLGQDLADIDPQSVTVFLEILVTCEIPLTALSGSL